MSNKILKMMREEGFSLIRGGKHLVWSDGVTRVVTSSSPKDEDIAMRRIRREIEQCRGVKCDESST